MSLPLVKIKVTQDNYTMNTSTFAMKFVKFSQKKKKKSGFITTPYK